MEGVSTADVTAYEAVERAAAADFWAAAPPETRSAYGVTHRPIGDGVLLMAPGLDGSMVFNRLLGYGLAGNASEGDVDEAIASLEGAGLKTWVLQVAPTATALAAIAAARGLAPHPRPWVKFARPPEAAEAATDLDISPAGAGDAAGFGAVFCAAYGAPPGLAPWVAALVGRPGWRCFVARDGVRAVGIGALFLGAGLGWLGFAGTLPSYRGRGVQGALMAARIAVGIAEGCRGFVIETGAPLPGEASPSFRNIVRGGFREVYRRPNLWRPPA